MVDVETAGAASYPGEGSVRSAPSAPSTPRSGHPSRAAYLDAGARSSLMVACVPHPRRRRRVVTGSPLHRTLIEERRGPPGSLGRPLRACRGRTPRRARSRLALLVVGIAVAFDAKSSLGTRNEYKFRGRMAHGPRACAPTLRRTRRRDRLQARYRLGRAHPWPDGFRTRWTTDRISRCHRMHRSLLTSVAWSHCLSFPFGDVLEVQRLATLSLKGLESGDPAA